MVYVKPPLITTKVTWVTIPSHMFTIPGQLTEQKRAGIAWRKKAPEIPYSLYCPFFFRMPNYSETEYQHFLLRKPMHHSTSIREAVREKARVPEQGRRVVQWSPLIGDEEDRGGRKLVIPSVRISPIRLGFQHKSSCSSNTSLYMCNSAACSHSSNFHRSGYFILN